MRTREEGSGENAQRLKYASRMRWSWRALPMIRPTNLKKDK